MPVHRAARPTNNDDEMYPRRVGGNENVQPPFGGIPVDGRNLSRREVVPKEVGFGDRPHIVTDLHRMSEVGRCSGFMPSFMVAVYSASVSEVTGAHLPPRNGTAGTEQQPERDEANEQPVPERLVITPPTIELDEPGQTDSDPHVDVVKPAAGLDGRGAAGQLVRPSSCGHVVASNRSSTWGS